MPVLKVMTYVFNSITARPIIFAAKLAVLVFITDELEGKRVERVFRFNYVFL